MRNYERCLNPNCDANQYHYARGLCRGCYHAARILIMKGRTTWAELEKTGKCLPRGAIGSNAQRADWFLGGKGRDRKPRHKTTGTVPTNPEPTAPQ